MSDIFTRANLLAHKLRSGIDDLDTRPRQIVGVLHDLIHDLANAQMRNLALEHELATLRASVVDAMSCAGPEVSEDERAG